MKHIDPDIKVYIRGKLTIIDGTALDDKDFTSVTNNFLNSLFSQCTVSLNGTTITQATELYNCRFFLDPFDLWQRCSHHTSHKRIVDTL